MLKIVVSNAFSKDLKQIHKRGLLLEKLDKVIKLLQEEKDLPNSYRDHILVGNYAFCRVPYSTRLAVDL